MRAALPVSMKVPQGASHNAKLVSQVLVPANPAVLVAPFAAFGVDGGKDYAGVGMGVPTYCWYSLVLPRL